jgi:hypothetical protein
MGGIPPCAQRKTAKERTRPMKRLLVFSPYALFTFHTTYEETIAKACRTRSASVEYLLCDGLLPECDQHWESKTNSERPLDLCRRCQARATVSLDNLGFSRRWLGEFVSQARREEAAAWAERIPPAEMRTASFEEMPLGEWVQSSVVSYFRQYPPDMNNQRVVKVYRGFLLSAAIVAIGLKQYLQAGTVDSALLFNGRQSITRVALEIFQQRGIRVLTHERPEYIRGNLNVRPNAHCMNLQPFRELWNTWSQVPLDRKSLDATLKWLIQRRYGANLAWIPFNTSSVRDASIRARFNFSPHKCLWALFTSSTDEVAGDPLWQGPYESQAEWVGDVVQWVALREDVELVIKVHPNLGGNIYIGKAVDELRVYQQMKAALPANVRIVMPDDGVNAYSLADEADLGLTFGSTIGLEMAMLGKPVLLASRAIYEVGSQFLTLRSRESLPGLLERSLQAVANRQIQSEAFRLAYYYIFAFEQPFPAVTVLGLFEAKSSYSDPLDLADGKDCFLDRICNFLINSEPLHVRPTVEEKSRSTTDEDAFFEVLAHSPTYLRNLRYERWLKLKSLGRSAKVLFRRMPFGIGEALLNIGRRRWHALLARVEARGTLVS